MNAASFFNSILWMISLRFLLKHEKDGLILTL